MAYQTIATLDVGPVEDDTGFLICEKFRMMVRQIEGGYVLFVPDGYLPSGEQEVRNANVAVLLSRMAQEASLAVTVAR